MSLIEHKFDYNICAENALYVRLCDAAYSL